MMVLAEEATIAEGPEYKCLLQLFNEVEVERLHYGEAAKA